MSRLPVARTEQPDRAAHDSPGRKPVVCSRGHGLLHISDSHCSWIDPEEWTGLDASWQTLFNDISSGEEGAEREEGEQLRDELLGP